MDMAFTRRTTCHFLWHGHVLLLLIAVLLCSLLVMGLPASARAASDQEVVTGFVYYDLNGNRQWDPGEPKAPGAWVTWTPPVPTPPHTVYADAQGNFTITLAPFNQQHHYGTLSGQMRNADTIVAAITGPTIHLSAATQPLSLDLGLRFTPCYPCSGQFQFFSQTGFQVDTRFADYFAHRGGVSTFGYPISRVFLFHGLPTQIFQRAVLQWQSNDSASLLNLLDPGYMPFTSFNGSIVPAYDPAFIANVPPPGAPGYIDQVMQFIAQNVPNRFAGAPVNFHQTFLDTVPPSAISAAGANPSLLPGFDLEIWGVPTSAPMTDPHNSNFIYQRYQRGIMVYQASQGVTEGLLLGQYFKEMLMGQGLPSDVAQEAAGSPYLNQYCPTGLHWICRPGHWDLATIDLTGAFEQETPAQ